MLNIELKNKISYINSGNYFSKGLIIKENLNEKGSIVLVLEKKSYYKEFKKIFSHLKINLHYIKTVSDLVNIQINKIGLYSILSDDLNKDILNEYCVEKSSFKIKVGEKVSQENLIKNLNNIGYSFSEYENFGTYKKIGDTVIITDFNSSFLYKIIFWGDQIEEILIEEKYEELKGKIKKVETLTLGSNERLFRNCHSELDLESVMKKIPKSKKDSGSSPEGQKIINSLKNSFCILDYLDFYKDYEKNTNILENFCSFDVIGNRNLEIVDLNIKELNIKSLEDFKETLSSVIPAITPVIPAKAGIYKNRNTINNSETSSQGQKKQITIITKNTKLIEDFINYNNFKNIIIKDAYVNNLKSFKVGIINNDSETSSEGQNISSKVIFICDDIISKIFIKKRIKRKLSEDIDLMLKIKSGDFVVHIDHGIGIFNSITKKDLNNIKKEYIEILYKDNDKLFVPITESSRLSKYVGVENPKLTSLNSNQWEKQIKKVNEDVEKIARELLSIFAKRKTHKGYSFIHYKEKQQEFQLLFPYTYTEDQVNIVEDIIKDMGSNKNMDRLLVGDVGFGKTEIAFNAIYNSFLNKKQSILISPLVVLAYEHFDKAKGRFKNLGLKIELLTRFQSTKETNLVLKKLKTGKIDLIIGTHKLLNKDIKFKNLGLLIVDEEHKFGVKDKEKIKNYKSKIDILSMSATPIPRSLNMALASIRDISILKQAPMGRLDIKTYVSKFSQKSILEAGKKEFKRGGQMFFIHNKVQNIEIYKNKLQKIFPKKKIIITHGQLGGDELEKRIIDFKNKKYDILLSTTVIENGIDFANVNTIFINNCENFGISQIHQLRGRVGRSDRQGYCYLLYKKENIGTDAAKRIKTIVEYSYLGAGFELAMKDLEIRGSGDILGIRQSGQATLVGINLFIKMLEKKIEEIKENKGKSNIDKADIKIDLKLNAYLPDDFFLNESDKLNFYREIESLNNEEDLDNLIEDFKKINPNFSKEIINLFDILRLKIKAKKYFIKAIKSVGINYQIEFKKDMKIEDLKEFLCLDKQVKFTIVNIYKLRSSRKNFANDKNFLQYLLQLLNSELNISKRIKLKISN